MANGLRRLTAQAKRQGYGVGNFVVDQLAPPVNPVDSNTLKVPNHGVWERNNPTNALGEVDTQEGNQPKGLGKKQTPFGNKRIRW
ncbi:hypothetical protein [Microseira wollei]|uniref:Uncharacterized protein n=1 Tax=Microseira wollei NIES-4236 TaxID=2530354 RepID=A0AAV3XTZ6_9CYAN|nr:hypothetical protein [Microseira wollei]GET44617.1 hypothetical protein MiSe_94480 [Microseira wollei NIES-4236]